MSETKTYVFPESGGNGGGSGMMAMLAPLEMISSKRHGSMLRHCYVSVTAVKTRSNI